ncbi:uncharacterized protein AB675_11159 [Cyphellophora attinorum]|uniref:Uncharacterized protein n=1 Tax=Cyphellophora attinorum TaxID=1664694 RepID=A0A0N1NW26_9EURO|nr:uncharacterized protein AB675_11159 [Phialophora attinorum]KPI35802.1 hypothetical protein AB675_11159 [Phialophora attinorum]
MVNELRVSIPQTEAGPSDGSVSVGGSVQHLMQPSLDQSLFSSSLCATLANNTNGYRDTTAPSSGPPSGFTPQSMGQGSNCYHDGYDGQQYLFPDYPVDGMGSTYGSMMPVSGLDFMNDQEKNISHDPLYGLFAPTQHFV